jgi:hypothetical protein
MMMMMMIIIIIIIITPWCRIFFAKLTVTQLPNNSPLSLWNPKVHYLLTKVR